MPIRLENIHAKRQITMRLFVLNRCEQTVSVGGQCVLDFHTANGGWKRYEEKLTGGAVFLYYAIGYDVLPRGTLTKVYTVAIDAEVVEGRNASRPYHIS